jgi:hypothetical protein
LQVRSGSIELRPSQPGKFADPIEEKKTKGKKTRSRASLAESRIEALAWEIAIEIVLARLLATVGWPIARYRTRSQGSSPSLYRLLARPQKVSMVRRPDAPQFWSFLVSFSLLV